MHFGFFGIVILLFIAYLIIKPFLRGNRRYYDNRYDSRGSYGGYGPGHGYGPDPGYGGERSGWGMAAGGFAAGALLTWLLEEGRIDSHQYDYYNSFGDQQMMMNELMQQNILQQHEIDDLNSRMNEGGYDNGYDNNGYDDNYDNGNSYDDSYDDGGGGWDDGNGGGGDDGNWM